MQTLHSSSPVDLRCKNRLCIYLSKRYPLNKCYELFESYMCKHVIWIHPTPCHQKIIRVYIYTCSVFRFSPIGVFHPHTSVRTWISSTPCCVDIYLFCFIIRHWGLHPRTRKPRVWTPMISCHSQTSFVYIDFAARWYFAMWLLHAHICKYRFRIPPTPCHPGTMYVYIFTGFVYV